MSMSESRQKHAIVLGASGVSGWALVNELLHDYPKRNIWKRVTALTNRPLDRKVTLWPDDSRLELVSGIDLLAGSQEELDEMFKSKVPGVQTVTHVFYYAYKASKDAEVEQKWAVDMLARCVTSLDRLSPNLEFVAFQTGAKMYGFHLLEEHYLPVPLKETHPRVREPPSLFYHPQLDWLASYAKDKHWTWNETRPDIIVGFVPNNNYYSLATSLGVFFTLWATVEGTGSEVPFAGTMESWKAKHNLAGADMIAKQTIYLSLHPDTCGNGEAFNTASSPQVETWESEWPQLCAYFGLKGAPPSSKSPEVRTYINEHLKEWKALEQKHGLRAGIADSDITLPGFEYFHLTQANFDRQYDMTKTQQVGFDEQHSVMEVWGTTFDRMRESKIIP